MQFLIQLERLWPPSSGQERYCGVGQISLHGGGGLSTRRVASPYTEFFWGGLRGARTVTRDA